METNRESFSGYVLMIFVCLFFATLIQLSMGEVGWQIVGMQPIPTVMEEVIEEEQVDEVAVFFINESIN